MVTLGERVKKRREELGLSQPGLAKQLGIHEMSISQLERGKVHNPRYKIELAKALKTTLTYLFEGKDAKVLEVEKPVYLARLSDEVILDPNKDYWVVEVDKNSKLFLTDDAMKLSKIYQILD